VCVIVLFNPENPLHVEWVENHQTDPEMPTLFVNLQEPTAKVADLCIKAGLYDPQKLLEKHNPTVLVKNDQRLLQAKNLQQLHVVPNPVRVLTATKSQTVMSQLRKALERQNQTDNDCTFVFFNENQQFSES
jgi:hypothetical protein